MVSFTVAVFILPFIEEIDFFIQTSPASPPVLFLLCLAFSTILYPAPEIGNNTRGDAVKIIATVTGCLLGMWGNYFNGMSTIVPPEGLFVIAIPSLKNVACAILRFMIGVFTIILVKTVVQTITLKGVIAFFGLRKTDKQLPKVQVPYRFITYMTLGVIISWTVPILHSKFGLQRAAFYQEVLWIRSCWSPVVACCVTSGSTVGPAVAVMTQGVFTRFNQYLYTIIYIFLSTYNKPLLYLNYVTSFKVYF